MSFSDPFKKELVNCDTLEQMLDTIKKHFDVENCKPGPLVKNGFALKVDVLIISTGVKRRTGSALEVKRRVRK